MVQCEASARDDEGCPALSSKLTSSTGARGDRRRKHPDTLCFWRIKSWYIHDVRAAWTSKQFGFFVWTVTFFEWHSPCRCWLFWSDCRLTECSSRGERNLLNPKIISIKFNIRPGKIKPYFHFRWWCWLQPLIETHSYRIWLWSSADFDLGTRRTASWRRTEDIFWRARIARFSIFFSAWKVKVKNSWYRDVAELIKWKFNFKMIASLCIEHFDTMYICSNAIPNIHTVIL